MAHGSTDNVDGDIKTLCYACPTVTGDIERKGRGELKTFCKLLKVAIDGLGAIAILLLFGAIFSLDKGKKVLGVGVGIFVEDALYVGHDTYLHLLAGFAAGIVDIALTDVGLA